MSNPKINKLGPAIGTGYHGLTNASGVQEYRLLVSGDAGNDIALGTDRGVYFQEQLTSITGPTLTGGNLLQFTYNDEAGNANLISIDLSSLAIDINVASVTYNPGTGALVVTETDGSTHTVTIGPISAHIPIQAQDEGSNLGTAGTWDTINFVGDVVTATRGGNTVTVTINETTTSISGTLGTGNTIGTYNDEDGVATIIRETITTLSGVLAVGNIIGTYTSENGTVTNIRETITDFLLSGSNLRYVDEAGANNDVAISALISADAGNTVVAGTDGKLFSAAGAGESTTVSDTNSINLTLSGVDITADIIVSGNAGNVFSVGTTGVGVRKIRETFSNRTDGTTSATLSFTPIAGTVLSAYEDGVALENADYSYAGAVVTMPAASTPLNGVANQTDWVFEYFTAIS